MHKNTHRTEPPDVALVMHEGGELPVNMDPVVAMDVVRRYVESERQRSRRVVVWTSTIFLLVVLVVLTLFATIGIYVVRNSRETTEVVSAARRQALQAAAKAEGVVDRVADIEHKSDEIRGAVAQSETSRVIENRMFKANLERFGKWVSANGDQRLRSIDKMESRLKHMESLIEIRQQQMGELERKYVEAISRAGAVDASVPTIEPAGSPASGAEAYDAIGSDGKSPSPPSGSARLREIVDPETAHRELQAAGQADDSLESTMDDVHVVRFPSGDRYEGQLRGGLLEGWGIYYFRNGDRYEGNFSDDMKQGYGVLYFKNGDVYKGAFLNDKRHGKGTYGFANGSRYIGEFRDGKRHGRGRYVHENGQEYIGEFRDGKADGPGFSVLPGAQTMSNPPRARLSTSLPLAAQRFA